MAGGDKIGDYGTMAERVAATRAHGSTEGLRRPPGPDPMAPIGAPGVSRSVIARRERADYRPTEPCHVTVTTEHGPVPGLLLEWRKPHELPWEGLVVLTRRNGDGWVLVREWLPAGAITRV